MRPERALAVLARVLRVLVWPVVRFDITGGEALNRRLGACIIVTAHRSLFDVAAGLVVFHRYRRYPRVLVERKYVERAWTRPFARVIGAIPVDRAAGHGQAFAAAVEILRDGATVMLLPEGRLHFDADEPCGTGPASTGVSRMARAAGVPVLAAGMVGTEKVWPPGGRPRLRPWHRPVVRVRLSDRVVGLDPESDDETRTEQVMADVRRLLREAAADRAADGPVPG